MHDRGPDTDLAETGENQSVHEDEIENDEVVEKLEDSCLDIVPDGQQIVHRGKNAFLWLDNERSTSLLKQFQKINNKPKNV